MTLNVGSRLGHCDVTAFIGEGGLGQVYRATAATLDEWMAPEPRLCVRDDDDPDADDGGRLSGNGDSWKARKSDAGYETLGPDHGSRIIQWRFDRDAR